MKAYLTRQDFKVREHCLWFQSSLHLVFVKVSTGDACAHTHTHTHTHTHSPFKCGLPIPPLHHSTTNHSFSLLFGTPPLMRYQLSWAPLHTLHHDCSELRRLWCHRHRSHKVQNGDANVPGSHKLGWDTSLSGSQALLCTPSSPPGSVHIYLHGALILSTPSSPVLRVIVVIN